MKNFYKRHYVSKQQCPTIIHQGIGGTKGGISHGHVSAKRAVESRIGRPLRADTKVETRGGNWRFTEPKVA